MTEQQIRDIVRDEHNKIAAEEAAIRKQELITSFLRLTQNPPNIYSDNDGTLSKQIS